MYCRIGIEFRNESKEEENPRNLKAMRNYLGSQFRRILDLKSTDEETRLSPVAKFIVPDWGDKVNSSGGSTISPSQGLGIGYRLWVFRAKTERRHECTRVLDRLAVRNLTYGLKIPAVRH